MNIRMTITDIMNKIIKPNINVHKVLEVSQKIEVNKDEIAEPPATDSTPNYLSYLSNVYDVVYMPLYDTAYIHSNECTHLFTVPVGPTKSYTSTNMVVSKSLPLPEMFVVRGFSMITSIHKEKLDKLMMRFYVIHKSYAKMPLSHLPFEYPDTRIIIPSGGFFHVEIENESTEPITDELVLFINGWMLRAVQ